MIHLVERAGRAQLGRHVIRSLDVILNVDLAEADDVVLVARLDVMGAGAGSTRSDERNGGVENWQENYFFHGIDF